jgi:septal ring factor EnvC (AmiA/AmiB activator)
MVYFIVPITVAKASTAVAAPLPVAANDKPWKEVRNKEEIATLKRQLEESRNDAATARKALSQRDEKIKELKEGLAKAEKSRIDLVQNFSTFSSSLGFFFFFLFYCCCGGGLSYI